MAVAASHRSNRLFAARPKGAKDDECPHQCDCTRHGVPCDRTDLDSQCVTRLQPLVVERRSMSLMPVTERVIRQVEEVSRVPVLVQADPSMTLLAAVKIARGSAPAHLVTYNPRMSGSVDYAVCYQCCYRRRFPCKSSPRFSDAITQTAAPPGENASRFSWFSSGKVGDRTLTMLPQLRNNKVQERNGIKLLGGRWGST